MAAGAGADVCAQAGRARTVLRMTAAGIIFGFGFGAGFAFALGAFGRGDVALCLLVPDEAVGMVHGLDSWSVVFFNSC